MTDGFRSSVALASSRTSSMRLPQIRSIQHHVRVVSLGFTSPAACLFSFLIGNPVVFQMS
jgi:hypothetical protein